MSMKNKWIKVGLPLLILLLGFVAMRILIVSRPEPQREERNDPGALVEVMDVRQETHQVEVKATGTVQPRQEISLVPQVSGRVDKLADGFISGGFFRQGDLLFQIETADYRLAADRAQAALAKAEYDLAAVEGQARIARQEWQRLYPDSGEEPNPLVLYEPQLKNARAALLAAQATLQQAQLDLQRTSLQAPFNAVIRSKSLDLGQYVRAGTELARLVGTDQAEILVPLPLEELSWLQIPRQAGALNGSSASVQLAVGDTTYRWRGRVARQLGDVDPLGRMARLVVTVEDPYGLRGEGEGRPPLGMGTFVRVSLTGTRLQEVVVLPATALRDSAQVWVMQDNTLQMRPVRVVRRTRDQVVIDQGLSAGDRVVLTPLAGAAEGMKLRVAGADSAPELAEDAR